VKIAIFQQRVECKGRVLGEVEVVDAFREIQRFAAGAQQVISAKIFNREPEMMQNSHLRLLSTKVQSRLRQ
jgi:hypothetical protein